MTTFSQSAEPPVAVLPATDGDSSLPKPAHSAGIMTGPRWWSNRLRQLGARSTGEMLFIVSTVAQPMVNIVGGFIAAKYLQPHELGTINTAALLPAYLGFLHFGVFTGLARNLPIAIGAGDPVRARTLEQTSAGVAKYVSVIAGLICLVAAVGVAFRTEDYVLFGAMVAVAVASAAGPISNHVDIVLRAHLRFGQAGWAQFVSAAFSLVSNVLVITGGMLGAISRLALTGLVALFARLRFKVWSPQDHPRMQETQALARIGLPLLLSGTLFSFLMVADRSVIVLMLGKTELGYFSLAGMIVNSLQVIPQSFSMILFPRMAREYGRTGQPGSLRRLAVVNLALNAAILVPTCIILYLTIGELVDRYLPSYAPGVPAAKIACLTGIFWIYLGVGSVFGVLNRMTAYLACMVSSILVVWVLGALAIHGGYGILGAAYARLAGTVLMCAFTLIYAFFIINTTANYDSTPANA